MFLSFYKFRITINLTVWGLSGGIKYKVSNINKIYLKVSVRIKKGKDVKINLQNPKLYIKYEKVKNIKRYTRISKISHINKIIQNENKLKNL